MTQAEFIANYNKKYRPNFNPELFTRSDEDLIRAIRDIIYSCERDAAFTIKVNEFEVIDNYDDINHILWEYEDSIINKGKKAIENPATANKKASNNAKKDNPFAFINLKDSDLKLIRVQYYIRIVEKKDGEVSDLINVYIAIPRIIDNFYFRLNGNVYSAMYQIVDASTYNNSAAKSAKKQSITFKTTFMPIRVYRYSNMIKDVNGDALPCTYFIANMFKKSLLLMKYFLAKMGFDGTLQFLKIPGIRFVESYEDINQCDYYIFPIKNMYLVVPKILYDSIQIVQSFVYTVSHAMNYAKDNKDNVFDENFWLKSLGSEFTSKDLDTIYEKGRSILSSLEFIYDRITMNDLKLSDEDKSDVYRVLRWMMYEFNALRQKDNLDISTKKVRWAEYIASLYAAKLAFGIYRVSDKGANADLSTIRKALQIPPMYLINAIAKCQLVNYKNSVNDMDAITALKYTYKGVSGIGEKSNAISSAYRSVHPSHLGRVDIDSSSNSDPGISGTICPLVTLHDGHFDAYKEPSTWEAELAKVIRAYNNIESRVEMCRIVDDHKLSKKQTDNRVEKECLEVARSLRDFMILTEVKAQPIDGYDIFGDGYLFYTRD